MTATRYAGSMNHRLIPPAEVGGYFPEARYAGQSAAVRQTHAGAPRADIGIPRRGRNPSALPLRSSLKTFPRLSPTLHGAPTNSRSISFVVFLNAVHSRACERSKSIIVAARLPSERAIAVRWAAA
jgi:hypothetical protein